MTIKAFVLDALSKFLTKLKSTYFTPMQSSINVLDDQTLISSTYADFYSKVVARANSGFTRPIMMNIGGAVSSVITDSDVSVSLRGYFVISDASQMLIDGMAMDGTHGYMCAFRVKLVSSSAATIQVYRSTKSLINDISTLNSNKQATITGGASSITSSNLTASMALVSNASGKVAAHGTVTSTELGYLDGVTSAIQTQLDGKAVKSHASTATTYGLGTASNYGHVKLSDTYKSKTTNGAAANGLGASQNALFNVYDSFVTQDYTFSGTYTAGTIGTRGWQGSQTIASPYSEYTVISVFIIDIGDSSATHPLAFLYSGKVYCNFYRATAAAASSNIVKVRVLFKK